MQQQPSEWKLSKVSDIPKPSIESCLVNVSVTVDGKGFFLFVPRNQYELVFPRYKREDGARFPKSTSDTEIDLILVQSNGIEQEELILPRLEIAYPILDVFPDGKVLVANTRCEWRSEGDFDLNGVAIDTKANKLNRILLGDGIEKLFIDDHGRIWVSYFDEGVFGNLGWGYSEKNRPIGQAGLNCFDVEGNILWSYPQEDDDYNGTDDCYALNVSGSEANIFSYSEFPLCKISADYSRTYWDTGLAGCHTFALSEDKALFTGQYDDDRFTAYICQLGEKKLANKTQIRLVLPTGEPFKKSESFNFVDKFVGRGKELHYFNEDGWFRCSVDEVPI